MRKILCFLPVFLILCLITPAWGASASSQQPNIVLFFVDDLDGNELGEAGKRSPAWGSYTQMRLKKIAEKNRTKNGYADPRMLTPHIDALAKEGATLQRFYISSPVCTASRYTLLTGRLASRSSFLQKRFPPESIVNITWNSSLSNQETSLSKTLQQAGYRTALVGKWHNFPFSFKFDKEARLDHNPDIKEFQKPGMAARMKANDEKACAELLDGYGWDFVERVNIGNSTTNVEWIMEGALKFLDQCAAKNAKKKNDQPFFLYVSLPVPHGSYQGNNCNLRTLNPLATSAGLLDSPPKGMPSHADVLKRVKAAGINPNNAMATHLDDAIGVVMQRLEKFGMRDNTLVWFISDHGTRGKNTCYETGACVPAFANWPGHIKPGTEITSLTGNQDIAPTLIEVAGGKAPADMQIDGRSLLSQLLGQPKPADWRKALLLEMGHTRAAVTERWKYIANRVPPQVAKLMEADIKKAAATGKDRTVFWSGWDHHSYDAEKEFPAYFDADQLYDLSDDLYEQKNLATNPKHQATLKELQGHLRDLLSTLPNAFGEFSETSE